MPSLSSFILHPSSFPRRTRRAFTTLELVVAISILVILAGLVFVGFKSVGNGGKTRSTQAALESARAMFAEIDATGGLAPIKTIYTTPPSGTAYTGAFTAVVGLGPTPIPAPKNGTVTNISADAYSTANTIRFTSDAVIRTQQVMGRLLSVPNNRTTLSHLPAERLLKWPGGPALTPGVTIDSRSQLNPQILADAWGNPIIYVPPAGLSGVTVAGNLNQIVTSVKVRMTLYNATDTIEPGATGFWASAGADGDFTTGDDNVYSFE